MDYNFDVPKPKKEVTLKELSPGDFFIFKKDYVDEYYRINLVCDLGRGIEVIDNFYNCLVLNLGDNIVNFEKGSLPVIEVEPSTFMTFKEIK